MSILLLKYQSEEDMTSKLVDLASSAFNTGPELYPSDMVLTPPSLFSFPLPACPLSRRGCTCDVVDQLNGTLLSIDCDVEWLDIVLSRLDENAQEDRIVLLRPEGLICSRGISIDLALGCV